jgi:hypothetical protein
VTGHVILTNQVAVSARYFASKDVIELYVALNQAHTSAAGECGRKDINFVLQMAINSTCLLESHGRRLLVSNFLEALLLQGSCMDVYYHDIILRAPLSTQIMAYH